jgi:PAS domain S-box-containing protein
MENNMNKLLVRQIKKHFGSIDNLPDQLKGVIQDINNTYNNFEDNTQLLQNSIEISSQELRAAFQKHKQDAETQKETIRKIKEAINALNPSVQTNIIENGTTPSNSNNLFDSLTKLIEERNQAEAALRNEQYLMTALMDNIPDHIYFKDSESRFIRISNAMSKLFGITNPSQIIGKSDFDFFAQEHAQQAYDDEKKIMQTGHSIKMEEKETWTDRPDSWVASTKMPLRDIDGKIIGTFGISTDITERKLVENLLRESENLQRSLLENIAVGIMMVDPKTRIIEQVNTFGSMLIGDSPENIVGHKCHHYVFPATENSCPVCNFNKKMDNAESVLLRINKPPIAVLKTVRKILIGGIEKLLESFVDISVQKEAEEALQNSTKKLEAILSASPDGIGISTLYGKVIYVSDKLAAMYGFPPERKDEILGQSIFNFTDPSNHEMMKENIGKLLANGGGSKITEYLTVRNDNIRLYADVNSTILYDSKGNPESILFIQRDVTNRKLAEEMLNNERALFRTIIDLIPDAVYVKDIEGRKILANPKEVQFAGKNSEEEIIGKTDLELYPDEEAKLALTQDQMVLQTGKPILDVEGKLVDNNGVLHWLLVSKVPLRDIHGQTTGLVGVSHDITEQKKIEAALLLAKQEADLGTKAKSEFLANMSHEIRTPLNGIIGFTDLLQKTPLNAIQRQYAENVNTSGLALLGIINDILDFSKIEAGKMELDCINADIIELVEQASDIIKYHASKKGIELLLNIPHDMPRYAFLDPIRLKQILVNLFSNAVKFTQSGEVELKVTFTKKDEFTGKFNFSVRDTGIGISTEQQKKLFKAFTQADSSTTRQFGGTGLGLTISNMLAEKMGSSIKIISEPGKGATFFFTIETTYEIGEKLQPGSLLNVHRILVIDDNHNNRLILEHTFYNWGIEFAGSDNALSAVKLIEKSKPFDVIIVDYHMPFLNGIDTIKMIREKLKLSPEIQPIILLHSSSDDIGLYEECKKLGVRFNLTKPVKPEELLHYLRNIHNQQTIEVKEWVGVPQQATLDITSNTSPVILVAEDVVLNMILVKAIINLMIPNVTIFEAANGKEAFDIATTKYPDLVLMDVQMPEMGGVEATIEIRKYEKNTGNRIPIVALSAGVIKGERENCIEAGMDDFLAKPIDQEALFKILEKYLRSFHQQSDYSTNEIIEKNADLHFDDKMLLKNIGYDKALFKELLDEVPNQFSRDITLLQEAVSKRNIENIKTIAHTIKGASLGMCFTQMAEIAKEIEICVTNNDLVNLDIKITEITFEWEQIQSILKKMDL